jgi:hypothetical protein
MVLVWTSSNWAVLLAFLPLGWFIRAYYGPVFPEFFLIWLGNLFLLGWKHRAAFDNWPEIRPALIARLRGGAR